MLKNTANTVSIPLKIIFDYSIQTSTFPDHWKLAKVMSLFKNGNKSLVLLSSTFDMEQKKLFRRLHLSISSTYKISLNIKKASGHDLISHHMLKNTANTVSIPLKIIFDYSIQTSTFPDHWKLA
jgi:hypothetical protein